MTSEEWISLASKKFPEIDLLEDCDDTSVQVLDICWELAFLADKKHSQDQDVELLRQIYDFVRWTIHRVDNTPVKEALADHFFDNVLVGSISKRACIDFLDWGDVDVFFESFTTEPDFEDVENFEQLCTEWKRRWSRNQKLPIPEK